MIPLFGFVLSALAISFFHAILPTHWLPFVLVGRAQRWSGRKVLLVATMAGGGHVLFTSFLGLIVVWIGLEISERIRGWSAPLASGILIIFGFFYLFQHFQRSLVPSSNSPLKEFSDRVAITSLLAMLTFSPCEALLPIYLSGMVYGWKILFMLTAVLSIGTLSVMLIFTSLSLIGIHKFEAPFIEKYEKLILGLILLSLGILASILH